MNIALVTHQISSHSGSRVAIELAIQFAKLGHPTTIYAFNTNSDPHTKQILHQLGISLILTSPPKLLSIPKWLFQTSQLIKSGHHQVISLHASLLFHLASRLSTIPCMTTYYGTQWSPLSERSWPPPAGGFITDLLNPFANLLIWIKTFLILKLNPHIVTISRYCQIELQRIYMSPSQVIYLGGDSYFFTEHNKLPITNYQLPITKLLSVSRLTPYKNFHLLITYLKNLPSTPPWKLVIVGSHPVSSYLHHLRQISRSLPIEFIINPTDSQLSDLYNQSDIYLTADRYLFFGLPIAEAAHYQLPSIAFRYAAAPELISDSRTGYIVNNQTQFSNRLTQLIVNYHHRKSLGINAKHLATKKFTWSLTSKNYLKAFHKLFKKLNPNP